MDILRRLLNERKKTKKTLKKAGIIAGGVVAGAGLMYAGYLIGADYCSFPGVLNRTNISLCKSFKSAEYLLDLQIKKPLMPIGQCVHYGITKDQAIELVKAVNKVLQEVN